MSSQVLDPNVPYIMSQWPKTLLGIVNVFQTLILIWCRQKSLTNFNFLFDKDPIRITSGALGEVYPFPSPNIIFRN